MVVKEPTFIGCSKDHSYCKLCISDLIQGVGRYGTLKCPHCSEVIDKDAREDKLDQDKWLDVLVLEVICEHCKDSDASWTGTLSDYMKKHIGKEKCPVKFKPKERSFQIHVKTLEDRLITFNNIQDNDTIKQLQIKIQDKEGIPIAQQWYVVISLRQKWFDCLLFFCGCLVFNFAFFCATRVCDL